VATPLYVKHPTLDGDGDITIATPDGPITRKVVAGVFEWPENVPLHNRFVEAPEPEALKKAKEEEERQALLALAAKFGLQVVPADDAAKVEKPKKAK